jgi:hypothetical protein
VVADSVVVVDARSSAGNLQFFRGGAAIAAPFALSPDPIRSMME